MQNITDYNESFDLIETLLQEGEQINGYFIVILETCQIDIITTSHDIIINIT